MMQRILALESLRGMAALIVVFSHFAAAFYPAMVIGSTAVVHSKYENLILQSPLNILINGQFAVVCFFILSGFVLSYGFFTRPVDLVSAAIKRYFRLAPIVFASVILAYILFKFNLYQNSNAGFIAHSDWLKQFWQADIGLLDALWQASVGVFTVPSAPTSLNPVLWTIYYELAGSLMVYAFLALMGKDRRRWLLYCVLLFVFAATPYLGFIVGMALCDLFVHRQEKFLAIGFLKKGYKIAMLTGGIVLASYPSYVLSSADYGIVHNAFTLFTNMEITKNVLFSISSVIFIILLLTSNKIKLLLERRIFVILGSMSFSLYATHLLVLGSAGCALFVLFKSFLPYNQAALAAVPCTIAISLGVAYLFRRYVDEPSIAFSGIVVRKLGFGPRKIKKEDSTESML